MNLILLNETKNLYQTKNVFNLTAKSMKYSTTTQKKTPQKSQNEFNYCLQAVKTTDYNCYLSTLLVPENLIRPAFAIKALNYELMSIKKSNQDPRISQIKLTFWKEQLDKIFKISNSVKNNKEIESSMLLRLQEPISNEILQVVKNYNLSKSWFNRLIDGRKSFLATDQFKNMDELERYGDAQMASIYYILLNCMKVNNNIDCDHVASHLGNIFLNIQL
jgi:phytoene/squalene synthetase